MSSVFQHISKALEQQGAVGVEEERIKGPDDRKGKKFNGTFGLSYISQPEKPHTQSEGPSLVFFVSSVFRYLHIQKKNTNITTTA